MARTPDFRNYAFDANRVDLSGKNIGRTVYWKLYAIENVVRVIVYSILNAQVGSNWWSVAVDKTIQGQVKYRMGEYAGKPWYSTPGKHEIYYAFLSDLNKIITAHSHLFIPLVPDIDQWVARIEQIRLPRNVVGHMNWPSVVDRSRIDVFYADILRLAGHLVAGGIKLSIP